MSAHAWTPAAKPGFIPLHPLSFSALLGKPFYALRHNPKVLFGFAIVIQLVIAIITLVVVGAVALATFTRLESVSPASDDFLPVMWGTVAINALVILAMSLISLAFTAIIQGVVAADIGFAALGEKPKLGRLWRRLRPVLWPLIGWSLLQAIAAIVLMSIVGGIIVFGVLSGIEGSVAGVGLSVLIGILVILAAVPLWIWLATKLLLVPSVLVLEHAGLRTAIVRSWRLTRGRFWNTLGVVFLVNLIMSTAAGLVSFPLTLLGQLLGAVIAPTGETDSSAIVAAIIVNVVPQLLVYVVQAVAIVVECAAATFIYLDSRMRYEGLDQDLLSYLERRDAGVPDDMLDDPFAVDPARALSSAPPPKQAAYAPAPTGWQPYPPAQPSPTVQAPPPPPPAAGSSGSWAPPGSGGA